MNGFGGLATAAGLDEVSENISDLKDLTSDLIKSNERHGKDISVLSTMSKKVEECDKTLTMVSSQLTTQKIMIVDALKVSLGDNPIMADLLVI